MDRRGDGVKISFEEILFHSAEKVRRGTVGVSLISGIEIFYA